MQLVRSRGYINFSRSVLQRLDKKAKNRGFLDACDKAVAGDVDTVDSGGSAGQAAPIFENVARGRKINTQFDAEVMGKLIYVTIVTASDTAKRTIKLSADDSRIRAKVDAVKAAEKGEGTAARLIIISSSGMKSSHCCISRRAFSRRSG